MHHVHAADTIGNVLAIDLRLSDYSEFTSVELSNGASATKVAIDATGIAPGEYTLKFESFNKNVGVLSALKIDTITIVVYDVVEPVTYSLATFTEELQVQTIISGKDVEWTLPAVYGGGGSLKDVIVKPDTLIAD